MVSSKRDWSKHRRCNFDQKIKNFKVGLISDIQIISNEDFIPFMLYVEL